MITMAAGVDGATLRWMPPLVVTADEVDIALQAFATRGEGHRDLIQRILGAKSCRSARICLWKSWSRGGVDGRGVLASGQ